MKTLKKQILSLMVVISLVTTVVACSPSDDSNQPNNSTSAAQTANVAESGTWKITYFYDSDHVETGNFSGYSFSFNEDGTLVAVNGSTTVTGTWSVTDSSNNSSDDDGSSSDDDDDFNIFFSAPPKFEDLSDDWDIISVSDSKIELIDVSGGNGGTDYLTFEKN
ncbi:hypothetical protein ATE92_1676 [Ulvibacter sp. MAR_2010_11]|uniref:hypothetical protein n=1 Tax=Ulvibacter sp. MAR_2010_11 TaxID=1250229 RepID=UPI000CAB9DBF|nr:hypothetical protein [Ulvibacter sp. MAR_2010_11]PKA83521.1 hypothetical protein ATE92_1676 [Ulvibacter sp. MAR_2010_11]